MSLEEFKKRQEQRVIELEKLIAEQEKRDYYLMGNYKLDAFFLEGVEGYISMCGHTPTDNVIWKTGNHTYLDEYKNSIWRNEKENVYLLDCGSGFKSGRLACLCIETGERYYSE